MKAIVLVLFGVIWCEVAMALEFSIQEVSECFGKHEIVFIQEFEIESAAFKKLERAKDGPLGTVEISEKKIVCPSGTFEILEVRKHPKAPGWLIRTDEKSGLLRCVIMAGGKRRVGIIVDTKKRQVTYTFDLPMKKRE